MSETAGAEIHIEDADWHPLADQIWFSDRLPDGRLWKGDEGDELQIEALAGGLERDLHKGAFILETSGRGGQYCGPGLRRRL